MADEPRHESFAAFWPRYVRDHSLPANRRLHFVGLMIALLLAVCAVVVNAWLILLAPVAGYGFAWYGHFFVERNRPATFTYPVWSLMGDFRMVWFMLRGRMDAEVERHVPAP